ncbi:MAG TPA: hypothetical protein VEH49_08385 [Methylomirabilota bacterium]|nr:hypothetical protein [Methylomirabilota bacterium]
MRLDPPPSSRDGLQMQDFRKQCKQAERDQESKKLAALIERVKRQLAQRQGTQGPRVA